MRVFLHSVLNDAISEQMNQTLASIRKAIRTLLTAGLALSAIYAASVYALNPEGRIQQKRLRTELERLHGANTSLAERNERLRLQIAAIRYDDRYLEQVAREDLGLVHTGEVIYRFLEVREHSTKTTINAPN